ncbi:putative ABC transporter permease [Candidatus Saccharibacteria bacterium]|nr:putative ABC transporter permease [Candidatus Saccharibacteria bacterium]
MNDEFWRIIATWFIYFVFYSVCGFFLEIIHSAANRKVWENRGFLFGPYCPIYGVGALILIAATHHFAMNPILVFLMAMLVCTAIEYVTAVILEKVFKMRWWDYSKYRYNFQGRIYYRNSILFGFGGLAIIYITQPSVESIVAGMESGLLIGVAITAAVIMGIDFVMSCIANYNIKGIIGQTIGASAQQIKATAISFYLHPKRIREKLRELKNGGLSGKS